MAKTPRPSYNYPPRAMRAEEAAAYLSMSRSMWLTLVDQGKMPTPVKIGSMTTWDRHDIDAAYDELKLSPENTVMAALAKMAAMPRPQRRK
jgi:predicted DNA-binding transcriptional regulator AlpA